MSTKNDRREYHKEYYLKTKDKQIAYGKTYRAEHKAEIAAKRNNREYVSGRHIPMSQNKECSMYLGVFIAEKILSKEFKDIIRMPINNSGYDFLCSKNKKIDVKSSCLYQGKHGAPRWTFHIFNNNIADYFLCIGFDDRKDLNPLKIWLIPGNILNTKSSITISNSDIALKRYNMYERSLDNAIFCCNKMKDKQGDIKNEY